MEKIELIKSDYSDKRNSFSLSSKSASRIDINHIHNKVIMVNSNTDLQ